MDNVKPFCCVDPFLSQSNCSWKKYEKVNRPKQVTDLELTRSDLFKMTRLPFYDNKCGSTIWKWRRIPDWEGEANQVWSRLSKNISLKYDSTRKKNSNCVGKSRMFIYLGEQNQLSLSGEKLGIPQIKVGRSGKSPYNWNSSKYYTCNPRVIGRQHTFP